MQLLCFLIIIAATQGDESSESKQLISPDSYNNLAVPNAVEYVSQYTLSVQTSYITSVECMRSSNHYIESGFSEIDSSSNDLESNLITKYDEESGSIENMMSGLQQNDVDKESQDKLNAVVSMTVNYYQNKNINVKKSETKLSEVTEVQQAQSILTARRCESSYTDFMNHVTTIKSKYTSESSSTDNTNSNQWDTQVKEYYDAREKVVNMTKVYASIREAFLFGSGINLCDGSGSTNTDQSLLDIYKTNDLSKFFGKTDNDASALLSQTVIQMYSIYKASLTNIYLKSVVHTYSDLAMRITIWEQVNLVRANFEYKSQNIALFIKKTQSKAESKYGADSEEYKKIMEKLHHCVNKKLLTVVKCTEVHYTRALNYNPDECPMKKDYNPYKVDTIEKYNDNILKNNTNAAQYDMRNIKKEECSYPSSQMCIPQKMYPLELNKLVSQTFICQVNDIYSRVQKTQYEKNSVDSFIYEEITLVQFRNSIRFFIYSATTNKIFIMNTATYTYVLLNTDQSTQSTDIQEIIDQTTNDVVGTLSVNTLEIMETFECVEIFITINFSSKTTSATNSQQTDSIETTIRISEHKSSQQYNYNYESSPPTGSNYPPDNGNYPNGGNTSQSGSPPSSSGNPSPPSGSPPPPSGSPTPSGGNYPNGGNPPKSASPPNPNGNSQPKSGSPSSSSGNPSSPSGSPSTNFDMDCTCEDMI